MYTPIIRNRQSELLALGQLTTETKAQCTPLLDLASPTKESDQTASQLYVERNLYRTVKALDGFQHVLIDSSELESNLRIRGDEHPLTAAASTILEAKCIPIPVTGLHRDKNHMVAAMNIRMNTEEGLICFRLDATDVGTASSSYRQLLLLLSDNSIEPSKVILLLDLQSVFGKDITPIVTQITRFISRVSKSNWATLIIAGYGIPDTVSEAIAVRDQGYIPRVEQDVYFHVFNAHPINNLWFGDYTTLSPTHVELDFRIIHKVMGPKIIYALDDSWFVVRGGPFSGFPTFSEGYQQYYDLAEEIVALEEYSGPDYSYGDRYIYKCANRMSSTGNPAAWIKACVNRHITLTAETHHHS